MHEIDRIAELGINRNEIVMSLGVLDKIRRMRFDEGMTYRAIAEFFPVCHQNVARICLGQAWSNVEAAQ